MLFPRTPILEAVCARAPVALMTAAARARLLAASRVLPDALSDGFLECPLGARGSRVDLLLCARTEGGTATQLSSREAWPTHVRSLLGWRRLLSFYERWGEPRSPLRGVVPLTLLELDLEAETPWDSPPGVHCCVDPSFVAYGWETPPDAPPPLGAARLGALASEVITALTGAVPSPALLERLERCRHALPANGRLLHLSVMTSRPGFPLKLNAVLPAEALSTWLVDIGWPGNPALPEEALARFGPGMRVAKVDLALGATLGARLGLELCFPGDPRADPRWRELMDQLVLGGLCTLEQEEALLAWTGEEEISLPGFVWPARLARSLEVKLVLEGTALEAKAYLSFTSRMARWSSPPPLSEAHSATTPLLVLLDAPGLALPTALCSPPAQARLAADAHWLPSGCCGWAFETRLGAGTGPVDLLGCLRASEASAATVEELMRAGWGPLAAFVERWCDSHSMLHACVPLLWLELDAQDRPVHSPPPLPGLSFCVNARPPGPRSATDRWPEERLLRVLDEALDAMSMRLPETLRAGVLRCFKALPAGGRLNHMGMMPSRSTSAARLALELPSPLLGAYLKTVGWSGSAGELAPLLPSLAFGVDRLGVTLDVGAEVLPRLGVELTFHAPPAVDARFRALLRHGVHAGWCAPDKQLAYEAWDGPVRHGDRECFERRVHHVKWVLEPGCTPFVKGYLALSRVAAACHPKAPKVGG